MLDLTTLTAHCTHCRVNHSLGYRCTTARARGFYPASTTTPTTTPTPQNRTGGK